MMWNAVRVLILSQIDPHGVANMHFDWRISVQDLASALGLIITLVAVYWRMRELIFKLHNENKTSISTISSEINEVNTKIEPIVDWWNNRQERRRRDG